MRIKSPLVLILAQSNNSAQIGARKKLCAVKLTIAAMGVAFLVVGLLMEVTSTLTKKSLTHEKNLLDSLI
mgnify:CR=1 FL=1